MSHYSKIWIVDADLPGWKPLKAELQNHSWELQFCRNSKSFFYAVNADLPGCIIVDTSIEDIEPGTLFRNLIAKGVDLPVIITTQHAEVELAVHFMKMGAMDFLRKPLDANQLIASVTEGVRLSISKRIHKQRNADELNRLSRLTPREHQVLELLIDGKLNKTVAAELGISTRTVEVHRANIMSKLQAKTISEVIRMALINKPQQNVTLPPAV